MRHSPIPCRAARLTRRQFLRSAAAATFCGAGLRAVADPAERAEALHAEIWRRFIDPHGVMLDFAAPDGTVPIPTPEECRLGKPNALGWWSPIENGGFFNGLYIEAAIHRWRASKADADAEKVRRLAAGLLRLASVSDVKGFVARGFATDGRAHYAMGSDDQTLPWFLGLWRYLESGLAPADERRAIVAKLVGTADEILRRGWQMPAEPPFGVRGGFAGFLYYQAPRLLFVARMMHALTGEACWDGIYRAALHERGGAENRSRLELCARGLVYDHGGPGRRHSWTAANCVAVQRALWEMETDASVRAAYALGLERSAVVATESLPLTQELDPAGLLPFEGDWRRLNELWKPQSTPAEAQEVAGPQSRLLNRLSPRRGQEHRFVREPAFAAWIVTLAPDPASLRTRAPAVGRVLAHLPYERLLYSQFFPLECAWHRLRMAAAA